MSKVASLAAAAALVSLGLGTAFFGCGSTTTNGFGAGVGGGVGTNAAQCPVCVTDQDCNGGVCAQFGSDIFCAPSCANGASCSADRTCDVETSATGDQVSVCVPNGNVCGPDNDSADAGPSGCASSDSDGGSPNCAFDAGSVPITGSIGANGGTASRLYFSIVGDTRPANPDDTAAYPTAIITKIYADVTALSPRPLFVVNTGDYMFATPGKGNAAPQLNLYLTAQKQFPGTAFPAMGNHECTGATDSNCATSPTDNMNQFMSLMLAPLGVTKPYYSININATDSSWTAKLVFIAANAWNSTQSSWLDTTLGQATTFTFVVRHEPTEANTAPGVTPSDAIIAKHPYTLLLTGHTHTYSHYSDSPKQIVVGNGGAPPTGTKNYGFGVVEQRSDGTIQVDVLDYQTLLFDPRFRFAVHPDGSPAAL